MKPIVVFLTPEQEKAIEPLMNKIREMSDAKKPGILAAQIFPGHMRVGIISHERGVETVKATGGDPTETIRYAPEL